VNVVVITVNVTHVLAQKEDAAVVEITANARNHANANH